MATEPSSGTPPNAPPVILLVDDDRDTLDMYSVYFESEGMSVATAPAPRDALLAITTFRPNLVITDVGFRGLPATEGIRFIEAVRAGVAGQSPPVIVLTGEEPERLPLETRRHAAACLVKPVLPDELLSGVRQILAGSTETAIDWRPNEGRHRRLGRPPSDAAPFAPGGTIPAVRELAEVWTDGQGTIISLNRAAADLLHIGGRPRDLTFFFRTDRNRLPGFLDLAMRGFSSTLTAMIAPLERKPITAAVEIAPGGEGRVRWTLRALSEPHRRGAAPLSPDADA